MLPLYTIAHDGEKIQKVFDLKSPVEFHGKKFQARPGDQLPIIIWDGNQHVAIIAHWGLRHPKQVTTTPSRSLLNTKPYQLMIRKQRCIVPSNCFFGKSAQGVSCVNIIKHQLHGMAGLFQVHQGHYYFTLIEQSPADILSEFMDSMPAPMRPDQGKRWLIAKHMMDITYELDRATNNWFDLFPVDPKIEDPALNSRQLLNPLGESLSQIREKKEMQKALDLRQERIDTGQTKR